MKRLISILLAGAISAGVAHAAQVQESMYSHVPVYPHEYKGNTYIPKSLRLYALRIPGTGVGSYREAIDPLVGYWGGPFLKWGKPFDGVEHLGKLKLDSNGTFKQEWNICRPSSAIYKYYCEMRPYPEGWISQRREFADNNEPIYTTYYHERATGCGATPCSRLVPGHSVHDADAGFFRFRHWHPESWNITDFIGFTVKPYKTKGEKAKAFRLTGGERVVLQGHEHSKEGVRAVQWILKREPGNGRQLILERPNRGYPFNTDVDYQWQRIGANKVDDYASENGHVRLIHFRYNDTVVARDCHAQPCVYFTGHVQRSTPAD